MILFIIGALFALIALAVLIFSDDAKRAAIIPAVVAVIFIGISCVSYVPTGYTGIVTTFGKVEDGTKDAGVVFKAPWQSIVKMDNRVQEMSMDLSAFSSDIQEVSTSVAVGYRINQANAMTIYKEVGKKYEDTLITPRVLETVKAVVAHYDASSLISNRDAVASQMDTKLREVLAQYNIDLQDTTGQTEYGTVEYRIGLLTLRQYGKYWRLIPKVDTPWWLATPYGTPNCSPYTNYSNNVWYVNTDGSNNNGWHINSYGVRPALYFPSTLWVSTEDEGEAGFCLADVPLDDLLAEIKSRAEE